MDGDEGEVVLGQDGAVEGKDTVGPGEVEAHEQRERGSDGYGDECEREVLEADDVVVGGEEPAAPRRGCAVRCRCGGLRLHAVHRVEQVRGGDSCDGIGGRPRRLGASCWVDAGRIFERMAV